ncbi:hypothetical protein GCM10020366_38750 [Saccharopolyspora gregorii]|uniref:Uncharacterized protein n=1 Tax=Saccharopolyspora gregorii TaxID=33914 RepID=A0ABP6RRL0_9PSEU
MLPSIEVAFRNALSEERTWILRFAERKTDGPTGRRSDASRGTPLADGPPDSPSCPFLPGGQPVSSGPPDEPPPRSAGPLPGAAARGTTPAAGAGAPPVRVGATTCPRTPGAPVRPARSGLPRSRELTPRRNTT